MARYFFDVETGGATEADLVGSDLASQSLISDLAHDLCLQIARENLPDGSDIWVRVRGADGIQIYASRVTLTGGWAS